ncbi:MAG: WD40 repeat domain-containing protein [Actinomycetota bacterium]|nr:WD40 repeat domain-containing protein [Actinomycetota bacterium]
MPQTRLVFLGTGRGDHATAGNNGGAVIDMDTGDELLELPGGLSTLSPDGSLVLTRNDPLEPWDVARQQKLREFKANFSVAWFSPTGSKVVGSTGGGRILVFDLEFGDLLFEMRGRGSAAVRIQMTDDESRIATFGGDGSAVWDIASPLLSTMGSVEFPASLEGEPAFFGLVGSFISSEYLVTNRLVYAGARSIIEDIPTTTGYDETTVFDLETGEVINSYPGLLLAVVPGGDTVALQRSGPLKELTASETAGQAPPGAYLPYERVVITDLVTGELIMELEGLCLWYDGPPSSLDFVETEECVGYPGPWREYVNNARFSSDGSLLAMAGKTGRFAVWAVETGKMIWSRDTEDGMDGALTLFDANVAFSPDDQHLVISLFNGVDGLEQPGIIEVREVGSPDVVVAKFRTDVGGPSKMEFTPDGRLLVLNDQALNVIVVDTEDWERVHTLSGQQGVYFPDIAVDPTGRFVATAGRDGVSIVRNLETGEEVQRFTAPRTPFGLRNVEWVDETTLMLGTRPWAVLVTLDPATLVETARSKLTRSFTDEECVTYNIDPCSTLEEMKTGS